MMRGAVGLLLILAIVTPSRGQDAQGPFPKFKDGVSFPPAEAIVGAPFDVAKLFAAPPYELNAAPLYLEALAEFGVELRNCFPQGPETDARFLAIAARHKQETQIELALDKDPKSVTDAEIDAMLANYDLGFRKLEEAQLREDCVFQTGVGFTALLPHVQAARQVARVAGIKIRRELERGQIDDAIADLKIMLRLTRDLQKRGYAITELVVVAMMTVTINRMVEPILAAPGLTANRCDTLMAMLDEYETKSVDVFSESLAMEYISLRVTLFDAIYQQQKLAKAMGLPEGTKSLIKTIFEPQALVDNPLKFPENVDELFAKTTPEQYQRAIDGLNGYFSAVFALKGLPRGEQVKKLPKLDDYLKGDDLLSTFLRSVQPSIKNVPTAFARAESALRGAERNIAIRRWQLTHDGALPNDLETACKAAGLKAVPVDPNDGKPLRLNY